MIEVESLCKTFRNADGKSIPAVDAMSFTAKPGEIFGLLGPNGAGKTTTLRLLCTVLKPTSGRGGLPGSMSFRRVRTFGIISAFYRRTPAFTTE